jgi:hypothetical protein
MWIAVILVCANTLGVDECTRARATSVVQIDDNFQTQMACYIGGYQRVADLVEKAASERHQFDYVVLEACKEKGHG